MAEDADQKPANQEQTPKPKVPLKIALVVLGVLLLEGATILVLSLKSAPKPADATEPIVETKESPNEQMAEVSLAENFSVDNYVGGRFRIIVTMEITAKVKKEKQQQLLDCVSQHETQIRDSIRALVSSAQPDHLKDPKLQVVKREIKLAVEAIVGEGLITEILIPNWQCFTQE